MLINLAKLILNLTKSKSKLTYKNLPQDDPTLRKPDINLAKKNLNWSPKIDIETEKKFLSMFKQIQEPWLLYKKKIRKIYGETQTAQDHITSIMRMLPKRDTKNDDFISIFSLPEFSFITSLTFFLGSIIHS